MSPQTRSQAIAKVAAILRDYVPELSSTYRATLAPLLVDAVSRPMNADAVAALRRYYHAPATGWDISRMEPDAEGAWVRYEDVAALAAAPLPSEPEHTADCRLGWDAMGDACTCKVVAPLPSDTPAEPHPVLAKYGLETIEGDPLAILERHLTGNAAATIGAWKTTAEGWERRARAAESDTPADGLDAERLALAAAKVWPNANERHVRARVDELAREYAALTQEPRRA